jgi:hypothetical protein
MTLGSMMMVAAPWAADIVGLQGLPKRLVFDLAGEPPWRSHALGAAEGVLLRQMKQDGQDMHTCCLQC